MSGFFSKLKNIFGGPEDSTDIKPAPVLKTEPVKKAKPIAKVDPSMGVSMDTLRPFFDADFYLDRYEGLFDADQDPLDHYMQTGWKMGFDPSPYFSTFYYLHKNPDVADTGVNPLAHFVLRGKNESRPIHPDEVNWALDPVYEVYDPAWVMP